MLVGGVLAQIPNNTLRDNTLVITNVNVTGAYQIDGVPIITGAGVADFTSVDADQYSLATVNVTEILYTAQGATATVGFNEGLDYLPNYWYCDGTADDVQINAALTFVNTTGGGEIRLETGDYYISASIILVGNTVLRGCGIENTRLLLTANTDMFVYSVGPTIYFFQLKDMTLNGQKDTYTGNGFNITNGAHDTTINNVFILQFKESGFRTTDGWGLILDSVIVEYCDQYGIYLDGASFAKIHNCKVLASLGGIYVDGSNNQIEQSEIGTNTLHGINLVKHKNIVVGNSIYENDKGETNNYGVFIQGDYNLIDDNFMDGGGTENYNIVVLNAGSVNNIIGVNNYQDAVTGIISDAGTDTKTPSVVLPFVDGTTFLSSVPYGWEINDTGEYAIALGSMPSNVNEVIRFKIKATTVVTETDKMRLEIVAYGASDNEAYTAETITLADFASTSSNFAANDAIYWSITDLHEADIDDLKMGDQLMIKIIYEAAGGADCDTDAVFLSIEIDYV